MTLNNVLDRLELLALSHKQINYYYFGHPADWVGKSVSYPACFVDITNSRIDRSVNQTINVFEIWFCDLVNVSDSANANEKEVWSDLTQVAEDYVSMLNFTGYQDDWTLDQTNYPMEYYREELTDWVGAVKITVEIGVDFLTDRCQVPAEDVTFETDTDMKIIKNEVYTGTGSEGTSVIIGDIAVKEILWVMKGDKLLVKKQSETGLEANDYFYNPQSGGFVFGTDVEYLQVIQILYRSL